MAYLTSVDAESTIVKSTEPNAVVAGAIKADAQLVQQRFNQFISGSPEQQALQIAEAERQLEGVA